mmetsp:Transcript_37543/g.68982  ORF Transcript_37543/g.68982 Transcript_37543/m.68982 type:complete len:222 (-) Transcript_37543:940-1605(-)
MRMPTIRTRKTIMALRDTASPFPAWVPRRSRSTPPNWKKKRRAPGPSTNMPGRSKRNSVHSSKPAPRPSFLWCTANTRAMFAPRRRRHCAKSSRRRASPLCPMTLRTMCRVRHKLCCRYWQELSRSNLPTKARKTTSRIGTPSPTPSAKSCGMPSRTRLGTESALLRLPWPTPGKSFDASCPSSQHVSPVDRRCCWRWPTIRSITTRLPGARRGLTRNRSI